MSDDPVSRATRAVRDAYDGASERSAATRRNVLVAAVTQRRRRRTMLAVVVPLAAALALSTAWAAVTGRLRRAVDGGGVPAATAQPVEAPGPRGTAAPPPGTKAPDDAEPAVEDAAPAPAPTRAVPSPPPPPPAAAAVDPEETLFATAHRAHFVEHDPAAALRAWDAYLARYPRGRFALEARYNRALSLVRLGRADEARAALAPFASGALGGYRQREARELLEALDGGP